MEYLDDVAYDASFERVGVDDRSDADEFTSTSENSSSTNDEIERRRIAKINFEHNTTNLFLSLPCDVLLNIMKWIVSTRLDVVSLARVSQVCKELYNLSQDESLWHSMCQRIWGSTVVRKPYPTWKDHYISRPHAHIHGVYISKTSYVRASGVSSFTSTPYCLVEYYRILRFFPNGEVLMLTTPQEPRDVVYKLKNKNRRVQGLLLGRYVILEDQSGGIIHAKLKNYYIPKDSLSVQQTRIRRQNTRESYKPINEYNIEMRLTSTSPKKMFNKLTWTHHSCRTQYEKSENSNTCVFDLTKQYPALYFYGVKSFITESFKPV